MGGGEGGRGEGGKEGGREALSTQTITETQQDMFSRGEHTETGRGDSHTMPLPTVSSSLCIWSATRLCNTCYHASHNVVTAPHHTLRLLASHSLLTTAFLLAWTHSS